MFVVRKHPELLESYYVVIRAGELSSNCPYTLCAVLGDILQSPVYLRSKGQQDRWDRANQQLRLKMRICPLDSVMVTDKQTDELRTEAPPRHVPNRPMTENGS